MALGSNVTVPTNYDGELVVAISALSSWVTCRDAGGMAQDNSGTVTIPLTHISSSTSHIVDIGTKGGTYAAVRMFYKASETASTDAVVKLFGSSSATDVSQWQVLKNKSKSVTATLAEAATDCGDGTSQFTSPDPDDHVFDLQGCRYLLVGVTVAPNFSTMASAGLQIKVF